MNGDPQGASVPVEPGAAVGEWGTLPAILDALRDDIRLVGYMIPTDDKIIPAMAGRVDAIAAALAAPPPASRDAVDPRERAREIVTEWFGQAESLAHWDGVAQLDALTERVGDALAAERTRYVLANAGWKVALASSPLVERDAVAHDINCDSRGCTIICPTNGAVIRQYAQAFRECYESFAAFCGGGQFPALTWNERFGHPLYCDMARKAAALAAPKPLVERDALAVARDLGAEVVAELGRAVAKHKPFNSLHEGYGVIMEEVCEFFDEVRAWQPETRDYSKARKELIQVAAMALRTILDVCDATALSSLPPREGTHLGGR